MFLNEVNLMFNISERSEFIVSRCKGTPISALPQSPFHGILHTKHLA